MPSTRRSPDRRRRRRPGARLLWLALLVAAAGTSLLCWARTPRGGRALLALGASPPYGPAQQRIGAALLGALPGAAAAPVHHAPLSEAGKQAAVECRAVSLPPGDRPAEVQARLATAAREAGGELLWAEELPRPAGSGPPGAGGRGDPPRRLDFGLRGRPTHTLVLLPSDSRDLLVRWARPAPAPRAAPAAGEADPMLAIVIDDWGCCDTAPMRELLSLEEPLTLAVIPHQPHTRRYAALATPAPAAAPAEAAGERARRSERRARGCRVEVSLASPSRRGIEPIAPPARRREVILHLPMEADGHDARDGALGADAVRVGMPAGEIARRLADALADVPGAAGVSNHMGSRVTADSAAMDAVMSELARRRLWFLDSLTTARSVAAAAGRRHGVAVVANHLFLDEGEPDAPEIQRRIERLARIARAQGWAVGIGHPRPATAAALREALPRLSADGIRLVTVGELPDLRGAPPGPGRE